MPKIIDDVDVFQAVMKVVSERGYTGATTREMAEAASVSEVTLFRKYGSNRLAEGKLPLCAEMCATKALLAGDGDVVSDIYRERITYRGAKGLTWGQGVAARKPDQLRSRKMEGRVSGE